MGGNQGQHASGGGAECHPQTDFGLSRRHGVGHDAVEPDERQQEPESSKRRQQNARAAAERNLETGGLAQRLDGDDRRRIERFGGLLHRAQTRLRVSGDPNVDDRIPRPLRVRVVHERLGILGQ